MLYAHKIEIKCLLKAFVIRFLNRCKGVKIAYSADVNIKVDAEGMCMFHPHSTFRGHIGIGSYVDPYSELSAYIGRFCSIAPSPTVMPPAKKAPSPIQTSFPIHKR